MEAKNQETEICICRRETSHDLDMCAYIYGKDRGSRDATWQKLGRSFKRGDAKVNEFNSSISVRQPHVSAGYPGQHGPCDHAGANRASLTAEDQQAIVDGLEGILADLDERQAGHRPRPPRTSTCLWRPSSPGGWGYRQAPAHRPQPQRPGGAGPAAVPGQEVDQLAGCCGSSSPR